MPGAYASETEVRPLLGNLKMQIDVTTIDLASAGAESEINMLTNRSGVGWSAADPEWNTIKKAGRLITAAECLYNVTGAERERTDMLTEALALLQNLMKFDTSAASGDYVTVSLPVTYPSNPQGIVWASSRYPALRGHTQDSQQYDTFFDNTP